jgi:hypothetical protein
VTDFGWRVNHVKRLISISTKSVFFEFRFWGVCGGLQPGSPPWVCPWRRQTACLLHSACHNVTSTGLLFALTRCMTTQRCCKRNSHVAGDDLAKQRIARNGAGKLAAGLQPVSKLPTEIERTDRERQVLLGSQRHVTVGVPENNSLPWFLNCSMTMI